MNRQEAARIVAVIAAACPAQASRLDAKRMDTMIDTYATLLDDLSYEQCNAALRVILQTSSFMPSVAEIRAAVLDLKTGPQRTGAEAWGEVIAKIGRYGIYRSPGVDFEFSDPITAKVVSALSWRELCNSENAVADRARFIEAYSTMATQYRRERTSPLLAAARDARTARIGANSIRELIGDVLKKAANDE